MSRPDLPPPGNGASAVLDPNAVNELFENVVYGDGLPPMADEVDRCAQRRRLEAERRRAGQCCVFRSVGAQATAVARVRFR